MRTSWVITLALLLAGCVSSPPKAKLTVEQATGLAVQLANDKAAELYHAQPFHGGQPARFADGHWVWTDRRGVGRLDAQVTVELAADGSTNHVDLKVFDSTNWPL
ncbi:MAG TPA: hypothetical protein VMB80_03780 [Candidatus Acidoferrum sp.]|nr:hypothetical protein [Candidatus Acidoferrum sp.]